MATPISPTRPTVPPLAPIEPQRSQPGSRTGSPVPIDATLAGEAAKVAEVVRRLEQRTPRSGPPSQAGTPRIPVQSPRPPGEPQAEALAAELQRLLPKSAEPAAGPLTDLVSRLENASRWPAKILQMKDVWIQNNDIPSLVIAMKSALRSLTQDEAEIETALPTKELSAIARGALQLIQFIRSHKDEIKKALAANSASEEARRLQELTQPWIDLPNCLQDKQQLAAQASEEQRPPSSNAPVKTRAQQTGAPDADETAGGRRDELVAAADPQPAAPGADESANAAGQPGAPVADETAEAAAPQPEAAVADETPDAAALQSEAAGAQDTEKKRVQTVCNARFILITALWIGVVGVVLANRITLVDSTK